MIKKTKKLIDKARTHEGLKRYGKNTAWLMAEKILRMFVGLFVGIWVARYLGPEQFGLLSYAQSFVFVFTALATLGLDGIVVRELVKDESKRDLLLGTAFALKLAGAILILPLLWLGVQFTNNDAYTNLLVFIIASATIFQSFNVIDFYYQSTVMSKYAALANSISLLLSSFIKIVLILHKAPLIAFALMFVFDALVLSLGLIYFYKKTYLNIAKWRFDYRLSVSLIKDSWPLILSTILAALYARIDQVMINEFLGSYYVGLFSASVRLTEAWLFIPVVISNSVFPSVLEAKGHSNQKYLNRFKALLGLLAIIGFCISIVTSLFSEKILYLLYGYDYVDGASVLFIRIWETLFAAISVAVGKWLIIENLQRDNVLFVVGGCFTNIILNYYLIPIYGIDGAALASLVSIIFTVIIFPYFHKNFKENVTFRTKAILLLYTKYIWHFLKGKVYND